MIKHSEFSITKAATWDNCNFCSTHDNLMELNMTYDGGHHGCSVTLCKNCAKELIKVLVNKVEMIER